MVRRSTMLLFILIMGMGGALFHVKFQVEAIEKRLSQASRAIAVEEENLHILKAEWTYLNEPSRLQALAEKYLDVQPVEIEQYLASTNDGRVDASSPIQLTSFVRP